MLCSVDCCRCRKRGKLSDEEESGAVFFAFWALKEVTHDTNGAVGFYREGFKKPNCGLKIFAFFLFLSFSSK